MAWDQGAQGFTVGGTCGTAGTVACPPPFSLSGWTYADQESAAGPYTSATSSASSMGQANTITRTGVGAYEVRFGGLTSGSDTTSGVMHVTARQGNANFCVVGGWDPDGTDRVASVFCYDAAGAPADTRFDVVFTRPAAGNEIRAFLWANAPSDDAYVPDLVYQYSAAGPIAAIERFAAGRYRAYLPALSRDDRLGFMLSAYGGEPRRCRVVDLGIRDDGRFGVDVACEDAAGAPADSRFTLSVIRDAAIAPMPYNVLAAYVRTRDAVTAEVGPDETYNEVGGTNTASRTATGRYVVRLGSFAPYGVVGNLQLTAVGEGVSHCTIESMGAAGNDIEVVVLCFDGATPTNSEFMLTYGR